MLCVATSGFVWPFRGQFGDDDDDDYDNYDGTALPSISLIVVFLLISQPQNEYHHDHDPRHPGLVQSPAAHVFSTLFRAWPTSHETEWTSSLTWWCSLLQDCWWHGDAGIQREVFVGVVASQHQDDIWFVGDRGSLYLKLLPCKQCILARGLASHQWLVGAPEILQQSRE